MPCVGVRDFGSVEIVRSAREGMKFVVSVNEPRSTKGEGGSPPNHLQQHAPRNGSQPSLSFRGFIRHGC